MKPSPLQSLILRTILGVLALALGIYLLNRHDTPLPTVVSPSPTTEDSTTVTPRAPEFASPEPSTPTTAPTGDGIALIPPSTDVPPPVKQVDASPPAIAFVDGNSLIVARPAGEIQLRGLGPAPVQILGARHPKVRVIAIQTGGDVVALGGADSLTIFYRRSNSEKTLAANDVTAALFTSDGRTLITGHGSGALRMWDAASASPVATLNPGVGAIRGLAYSSNGHSVAAAGNGVAVWDAAASTPKTKLAPADTCTAVAFSPDGHLLAVATAAALAIYETTFWQKQAPIAARACTNVAFWRGGSTIVTTSADGSIQFWDLASRRSISTLGATAGAIFSLSLSPDDRTIAASSAGGVIIWDSATRTSRRLN